MMKTITILLCIMLSSFLRLNAQATLSFEKVRVKKSELNQCNIKVIDKRPDTGATLGKVKVDYRRGLEALQPKQSLANDMEVFYKSIYASQAIKTGDLLILVYKFEAQEDIPGLDEETASFKYSADYFLSDSNGKYKLIGAIDTTILVQAFDVTKPLFKVITSTMLLPFNQVSLMESAIEPGLSANELMAYNDTEKKYFRAYRRDSLPDGVYTNWNDFLALRGTPNMMAEIENTDFKFYDTTRSRKRYFYTPLYRILLINGKAYYRTSRTYVNMFRKQDDNYVIANITRVVNKVSDAIAYGMMYGLFGAIFKVDFFALPGTHATITELYECKVNFRTGELMPVKKIDRKQYRHIKTN